MTDFTIRDYGSICLLKPLTTAARLWTYEHLPEDAQRFGDSIVVENRYIATVAEGIVGDGLTIDIYQ